MEENFNFRVAAKDSFSSIAVLKSAASALEQLNSSKPCVLILGE